LREEGRSIGRGRLVVDLALGWRALTNERGAGTTELALGTAVIFGRACGDVALERPRPSFVIALWLVRRASFDESTPAREASISQCHGAVWLRSTDSKICHVTAADLGCNRCNVAPYRGCRRHSRSSPVTPCGNNLAVTYFSASSRRRRPTRTRVVCLLPSSFLRSTVHSRTPAAGTYVHNTSPVPWVVAFDGSRWRSRTAERTAQPRRCDQSTQAAPRNQSVASSELKQSCFCRAGHLRPHCLTAV